MVIPSVRGSVSDISCRSSVLAINVHHPSCRGGPMWPPGRNATPPSGGPHPQTCHFERSAAESRNLVTTLKPNLAHFPVLDAFVKVAERFRPRVASDPCQGSPCGLSARQRLSPLLRTLRSAAMSLFQTTPNDSPSAFAPCLTIGIDHDKQVRTPPRTDLLLPTRNPRNHAETADKAIKSGANSPKPRITTPNASTRTTAGMRNYIDCTNAIPSGHPAMQ
jgi:hypothetical protein